MTSLKSVSYWLIAAGIVAAVIAIWFPDETILIAYMGYITVSNSFIAIPHEPLLLYFGKTHGWYWPVLLAIIPTVLGCYIDYLVLDPLNQVNVVRRIKNHPWYIKMVNYFSKFPMATIALFALTPLPFYAVRILSIFSGYPAGKYVQAVLLGRVPRYLFLAMGGKVLNIENKLIIFVALVAFAFYITGILLRKYAENDNNRK